MRSDGAVLLRRRPDEGLLGGMIELPTTPWRDEPWDLAEASAHAPQPLPWQALPEPVRHGFTHFEIELLVAVAETEGGAADGTTAQSGARPRASRNMRSRRSRESSCATRRATGPAR